MSIARLKNVVWVSWVSQGADRKRSANPFTHFVFKYVVDNGIKNSVGPDKNYSVG